MTPLDLPLATPPAVVGRESHRGATQWLLLAATSAIGVAGTLLSDFGNALWHKVALQLAFALGLSLFAVSWFRKPSRVPVRIVIRDLSRQIYLVLYVLAAAKVIQWVFRAPNTGAALRDAMHGLWPYFAGALLALVLARVLAFRLHSQPARGAANIV
jgi:hypothetical protein